MSSHAYRRIRRINNLCRLFLFLSFLLAASVCQAFLSIQSSRIQSSCHLCRHKSSGSKANIVFNSPLINASKNSVRRYATSGSADSESNGIDANSTIVAINATSNKLAPSGWANIGRFLLPSWHSSTESDAVDNINMEDNSALNTSTVTEGTKLVDEAIHISNEQDRMDVIDVECRVDEVEDCEPQPTGEGIIVDSIQDSGKSQSVFRKALSGTVKALFRGGKTLLLPKMNSTSDETTLEIDDAVASNTTESDSPEEVSLETEEAATLTTEASNKSSIKQNRRSRRNSNESENWLTTLESKDIDTTTRSKQRKWARRQRRLMMMAKTAKNAVLLFVVTFFLGNIMNQFVDLDEDGSFEVRFGKVLSSSSPPSSSSSSSSSAQTQAPPAPSTPSSPQVKKSPRTKPLFQTVTTPKQNYFTDINTRSQGMTLVARAVRQVGPAVVRVETETDLDVQESSDGKERESDKGDGYNGEGEDRGDVFDGVPEAPPPSENNAGPRNIDFGQGSGMIVNKEGYILTNAHVVDGSNRIYITLTDGRRFRAELQGSDDIVDIAVLKIVPDSDQTNDIVSNLPVAQLGNSDQLEVGQFVTAIGCPGGLDNTCTIGIISGLKRCPNTVGIPDKMGVLDYIQTDAAINQGNSGGPLVDVESGNIVGINTCIRANMEGTSFAIPTNKILAIVDDLAMGITPTHGYIGVHMVRTGRNSLTSFCWYLFNLTHLLSSSV
jgi:S1-C subfamily serine protease